jgi:hypothetical protein
VRPPASHQCHVATKNVSAGLEVIDPHGHIQRTALRKTDKPTHVQWRQTSLS